MRRQPVDPATLGGEARVRATLQGLEQYAGALPGFRRAHARGVGFRGHFTATPEAAALTTAAHLQGDRIETVVRLSNGASSPYAPDRAGVLGLGVRFDLPAGAKSFWAALNIANFPAAVPDDFVALNPAQRRGKNGKFSPLRIAVHIARHPRALGGLLEILRAATRPSFAATRFHGLHAYWLVAADGTRQAFRYRWLPIEDVAGLSPEQQRMYPPQYLVSEIKNRVARGPVAWKLSFQLAEPGDPTHDLTRQWPKERREIVAGELVIERLHEDPELVDGLNFDPTIVPAGIELSDDPVLHFRSEAYKESRRRRGEEPRPDVVPE